MDQTTKTILLATSAAGALVAAYMVYVLLRDEEGDQEQASAATKSRAAPAHQHTAFSSNTQAHGLKKRSRGKNDKTVTFLCFLYPLLPIIAPVC